MEALQKLVAAGRQELKKAREDTNSKWVKRKVLEEARRREEEQAVDQQESLDAKRKRKEAERLSMLEELLDGNFEKKKKKAGGASTGGKGDAGDPDSLADENDIDPTEQRELIFYRLRVLGEPVTFFGETDHDRYKRLCRLELLDHDDDLRGGQQNAFLERTGERKRRRRDEDEEEDEDEDEEVFDGRREGSGRAEAAGEGSSGGLCEPGRGATGHTEEETGRQKSLERLDGTPGGAEEEKERKDGDEDEEAEEAVLDDEEGGADTDGSDDSEDETVGNAAASKNGTEGVVGTSGANRVGRAKGEGGGGRGSGAGDEGWAAASSSSNADGDRSSSSSASSSQPPETVIRLWLKRMLKEWGEDLASRTEGEKQSADVRLSTKLHRQSRRELKPLYRKLRSKTLEADVLEKLLAIVDACNERRYRDAHDTYMLLAIGNAAWPMGVTMVGIHERAGRTKIFNSKVAHILNDEATRKYIQIVKRLMSFCQRRYTAEPSQTVSISTIHI